MNTRKIFTILSLFVATLAYALPTQGLIYNFNFDGNLNDSITSSTSLTAVTAPSYVVNRAEEASRAVFAVSSTKAVLPNLPVGNSARSISIWVKFTSLDLNEIPIISYGTAANNQAFGLSVLPSSKLIRFYGWASDFDVTYRFSVKEWYHITLTYDGMNASIWVNGHKIGTQVKTSWNTVGQQFRLCETPVGNSAYLVWLDDLRIYNRSLSDSEITDLSVYPIDRLAINQSVISYYGFENSFFNHNNQLELENVNSVVFQTGKVGNGIFLSGHNILRSNGYSTLLENVSVSPFTISFWKKDVSLSSYSTFVELFGNYFARYNATRLEGGYQYANSSTWGTERTASAMVDYSNWHHYSLVHDPARGYDKIFVDGSLVIAYMNNATMISRPRQTICIGGGLDGTTGDPSNVKYFCGFMDELYFFNKALNQYEVEYVMQNDQLLTSAIPSINVSKIEVYPNPCVNYVRFGASERVQKALYTIDGRFIAKTNDNELDVSSLSSGVYFVKFSKEGKNLGVSKFVKK